MKLWMIKLCLPVSDVIHPNNIFVWRHFVLWWKRIIVSKSCYFGLRSPLRQLPAMFNWAYDLSINRTQSEFIKSASNKKKLWKRGISTSKFLLSVYVYSFNCQLSAFFNSRENKHIRFGWRVKMGNVILVSFYQFYKSISCPDICWKMCCMSLPFELFFKNVHPCSLNVGGKPRYIGYEIFYDTKSLVKWLTG